MLPERSSSRSRGESKIGKMKFEPVVGDAAGLFEARHVFSDLEVNPAVGTKCAEVILVNDFVRDTSQCEFHLLIAGHFGTVVKVLDV